MLFRDFSLIAFTLLCSVYLVGCASGNGITTRTAPSPNLVGNGASTADDGIGNSQEVTNGSVRPQLESSESSETEQLHEVPQHEQISDARDAQGVQPELQEVPIPESEIMPSEEGLSPEMEKAESEVSQEENDTTEQKPELPYTSAEVSDDAEAGVQHDKVEPLEQKAEAEITNATEKSNASVQEVSKYVDPKWRVRWKKSKKPKEEDGTR